MYVDNLTICIEWYKIKASDGVIGWIYGDNLAVILPEYLIDTLLRSYNKKAAVFDNGFEKSTVWVAGTDGHDAPSTDKVLLNTSYKEFYLVVTNQRGRSVVLNYANTNESGRKTVQSIHFQDVTDNKINDIILETTSLPLGSSLEEHLFEIYSFKSGALSKVFEERMTLTWESNIASPAVSKFIDIEGSTIRVAYVDYVNVSKFSLNFPTDMRTKTQERCLEYVTYSYHWDKMTRTFTPLYAESRRSVQAVVKETTVLKENPSIWAEETTLIQPTDRLEVIKHFENIIIEKGQKKMENWLYVKHSSGSFGYLKATEVRFINTEHGSILTDFYVKSPLSKQDWRSNAVFVHIQ